MASRRKTPVGRRLTARSVIASTLLGVDPPELSTRSLVATAELLGITPGTARVAISRMTAAGELLATDGGYRLAGGALLARSARQSLSRRGPDDDWDGRWRVVVALGGGDAADRADLRTAFAALRFASLRNGVWARPANLPAGLLADHEATVGAATTGFDAFPDDPKLLAGRLWDLRGWASEATGLVEDLTAHHYTLIDNGPDALADGFIVSAAVLRHLQADPLLPPQLLPADWPGPHLRQAHRSYDEQFKATLASWQRSLPPSSTG